VCGPWNQVQPGNLSFYSIDIDYSISIGGGGRRGSAGRQHEANQVRDRITEG